LLAAEIGGVAIAVKLVTGVPFSGGSFRSDFTISLVLWTAGFAVIEYGIGLLGLVTLSFVVAAWQLQPDTDGLLRALVPSAPRHDYVR
jgi:Mn2+/Fe2+ NRAMP family transporter